MYFFLDSSAWGGLFTLIFLEIILNIYNTIFITFSSKKFPLDQCNQTRNISLILALFIRFIFLIKTSFLINLIKPILISKIFIFSIKEIILLISGIYLCIKIIFELFNYINIKVKKKKQKNKKSRFWYIIVQLIIFNIILSINFIMTAIEMTQKLSVIRTEIIISTILMIFSYNLFIKFINWKKKIIILYLIFLLIISLNLILESLRFYIPKEYLYISIGFYLFIEIINQIRKKNIIQQKEKKPIRKKIYNKIYSIINTKKKYKINKKKYLSLIQKKDKTHNYINNKKNIKKIKNNEIKIIINMLKFNNKKIKNIIIPKEKIVWIDITKDYNSIKNKLLKISHNIIPVCEKKLNEIIGVVPKKKLLQVINNNKDIYNLSIKYPPFIILETITTINLLNILRYCKNNSVIISNEFGIIKGLIKPIDIFNIIAGKFLNKKNVPKIIINNNNWIVHGTIYLNDLKKILNINIFKKYHDCISIADFLIKKNKNIPKTGTVIYSKPYNFLIVKSNLYQIHLVRITKNKKK
ncbi:TerC family protein [Buchnera aphidicola]|uniref:TerC family protein n=1 Tax=Buchnera aphidicola TaxID=9 RepID=UPI00107E17EE|nr:transporter associated domain-containing protein [Buchnera aphidicola]VFP79219.1 UPF0053 inner membrane protein YoaE [Buchnera aphidicola (Cinara curtihirsuta)]